MIDKGDRYLKYHVLETVMACARGENIQHFVHIVRALENDDEVIRVLATRLISNAEPSQLAQAARIFNAISAPGEAEKQHRQGLHHLIECDHLDSETVTQMIAGKAALTRKYGVIAAKKLYPRFPTLIVTAASSDDPEVSRYASEVIEDAASLRRRRSRRFRKREKKD